MNTVMLDSQTYQQVREFAKKNNMEVAEVIKTSVTSFLAKLRSGKTEVTVKKKELPAHLKRMKGILAGVEDSDDEKLNYLLEKYK